MLTDDNEPIGILLCSEVGQEMAEYTMMGADANLFLSKYQLELPSTEHFTEFLRKENEGLNKDINKLRTKLNKRKVKKLNRLAPS